MEFSRKALSDMLTLKPYWGKPAVRNFRGGDGDVGIIRSPVRAIALLDLHGGKETSKAGLPTSLPVQAQRSLKAELHTSPPNLIEAGMEFRL